MTSAGAGLPGAAPPPRPPVWRQREYLLLWGAQVVSNLGSYATGIIYPLLVLALTQSPTQVGIVSALRIGPYLLLSLPVGALIDRWNRRRVMLVCDVGGPWRSAACRWRWPSMCWRWARCTWSR